MKAVKDNNKEDKIQMETDELYEEIETEEWDSDVDFEETEYEQDEYARPVKSKRKLRIICACILASLIVITAAAGFIVTGMNRIYPNLVAGGLALGGKTVAEAERELSALGFDSSENQTVVIDFPFNFELSISAAEAGVQLDSATAAREAYEYGRGGNIFANLIKYISCSLKPEVLPMDYGYTMDTEYIRERVEEISLEVLHIMMESEYTINEDSIIILKGAKSIRIDEDEVFNLIVDAFNSHKFGTIEYRPVITSDDDFDLETLYETVFTEPVDSVYNPETGKPTDHVVGLSFDISLAEELFDSALEGEEIVIPLVITEPEITSEKLASVLFANILGEQTTYLTYSYTRNNNITKACEAINELVLNPGEEFSYNGVVGERTAAGGYMSAGAYMNGKVVNEIGGGICQVSSTLYYSALLSNLEIVDRTCHYFAVTYLPPGLDATVSWKAPDFKFKNNRDYPIKIVAYTNLTDYTVTIKIYGTDVDGSYVKMTYETWATATGTGAVSYRLVYDKNGNLISKTEEARSLYHYHIEDEEESPSPTPDESPSAEPTDSPPPTDGPISPPTDPPPDPTVEQPPPSEAPVIPPGPIAPPSADPDQGE